MEKTLLERAARAAEFADEKFVADFPGEPSVARADPRWAVATARAVLGAIREPSEGMVEAAQSVEADADCSNFGDKAKLLPKGASDVYHAMIDALLSDSPSERKR